MPKIFTVLDKAKPVFDMTDKILMTICKLLLIADILIATPILLPIAESIGIDKVQFGICLLYTSRCV